MGLFDKKYCDICGEKIGFLGNRKLEDGNLCKDCARKLSPLFRERRSSTVEEIRAQLAYREENARKLEGFHPDRAFGTDEKIYLDMTAKQLIVTSASDIQKDNPDLIDSTQILSWETEIEDNEEELFDTDENGEEKSFQPPKYQYSYEFYIRIKVDSPWFDEIEVDLNNGERPESKESDLYLEQYMQMRELCVLLSQWTHKPMPQDNYLGPIPGYFEAWREKQVPMEIEGKAEAPQIPEGSWQCFHCRTVNSGKFCSECGKQRPSTEKRPSGIKTPEQR